MQRKTAITLDVTLDANQTPENMHWSAPDGGVKQQPMEAFFLSTWDKESQESARIDLWTKEMRTDEMKHFFHQTLVSMADTLERATNEDKMAADMRDFCHHFAEKLLR